MVEQLSQEEHIKLLEKEIHDKQVELDKCFKKYSFVTKTLFQKEEAIAELKRENRFILFTLAVTLITACVLLIVSVT